MKNRKSYLSVSIPSEWMIAIAIIAILVSAIFVAIDPVRRLHESRNARRSSDIATILDAIKTYQADNEGAHYTTVENLNFNLYYQIGTDVAGCAIACGLNNTEAACVSLSAMGINYLALVPTDPKTGTNAQTGYAISKDSNGAITVQACNAEGEGPGGGGATPSIVITR